MPWRGAFNRTLHLMATRPLLWVFAVAGGLVNVLLGPIPERGLGIPWAEPLASMAGGMAATSLLGLGVWVVRGMLHAWLRAGVVHQVLARPGTPWRSSLRFAAAMSAPLAGITLVTSGLLWAMGEITWVPIWAGQAMGIAQVEDAGMFLLFTWWLVWGGGMVVLGIWASWAYQACLQEQLGLWEALASGWRVVRERFGPVLGLFLAVGLVESGLMGLVLALAWGAGVDITSVFAQMVSSGAAPVGVWVGRIVVHSGAFLFQWVLYTEAWPYIGIKTQHLETPAASSR